MKAFIYSILLIAIFSLTGCDNKKGSEPNAGTQEPKQVVLEVETGIAGEYKLIKVKGSDAVFVLKDGKISPITSWNWVVKNAPNKTIDTVSQAELSSYTVSGIIYK